MTFVADSPAPPRLLIISDSHRRAEHEARHTMHMPSRRAIDIVTHAEKLRGRRGGLYTITENDMSCDRWNEIQYLLRYGEFKLADDKHIELIRMAWELYLELTNKRRQTGGKL